MKNWLQWLLAFVSAFADRISNKIDFSFLLFLTIIFACFAHSLPLIGLFLSSALHYGISLIECRQKAHHYWAIGKEKSTRTISVNQIDVQNCIQLVVLSLKNKLKQCQFSQYFWVICIDWKKHNTISMAFLWIQKKNSFRFIQIVL